jgi:hypothetical protein
MVVTQNPGEIFDLRKYYTQYISYRLDAEKKKALKLFLDKLAIRVAV